MGFADDVTGDEISLVLRTIVLGFLQLDLTFLLGVIRWSSIILMYSVDESHRAIHAGIGSLFADSIF